MNNAPLVSIIVNCFNGEKYLSEAINSILSQTYNYWEVIFWDNKSTDRSSYIFKRYKDNRLRYYLSEKHSNLSQARVCAIEKSKGDLISFLDVDDYWDENFLKEQVSLFNDINVKFSCSNFFIVDDKRKTRRVFRRYMPQGNVVDSLLCEYFIGLLTLMIRRDAYFYVGGFDSNYHIIGDFDLVMKLARYGVLASNNRPLAYCRKHTSNESLKKLDLNIKELKHWYTRNKKFYNVNNSNSLNKYKYDLAYKEVSYEINSGSVTLFEIIKLFQTQTIINITRLIIKQVLRKIK